MKLPNPRDGEVVLVRQRPVPFSYYPTFQGKKREGIQSTLFATDPWHLIRYAIEKIGSGQGKSQAFAFLAQAKDFFSAAQHSDVSAAKPLLLYYSFLNLAKCFIVKKTLTPLTIIKHGLSEQLPTTAGAVHGHVSADITANPNVSAFVLFARALGASLPAPVPPKTSVQIRSQDFLSQVLLGHRIFCQAEGLKERFVSLERIEFMHKPEDNEAWLRVRAFADDFSRLGYPLTGLSKNLSSALTWRNVNCSASISERRLIESETTTTVHYGQRPSQAISTLSKSASPSLWRSVTAYPPYRKYYIYQPAGSQTVLHQLLSLYLSTFYFGSITRYKPEQFEYILKSPIGPFVFEFFTNQPSQFVYLLASEFAEQEVARAAVT